MGARETEPEIEVTPEMNEAGVGALLEHPRKFNSHEIVAEAVYRAMGRALARLVQGETFSWKEVLAVTPETKKSVQLHRAMREREPCDAVAA